METKLTFNQHRFLKQIADAGGKAMLKDLKPKTPTADRPPVIAAGLIEQVKKKGPMAFELTEKGKSWLAAHPEPVPDFPTTSQRIFLTKLAFMPTDGSAKGLAGLLKKKDRDPLEKEWVMSKKVGRAWQFELTETGWQWVEEHLGDPIIGGGAANSALGDVLSRVHLYLKTNNLRLADLILARPINPLVPEVPETRKGSNGDAKSAIRDACLQLAGGATKTRVRLAALRDALQRWSRDQVDHALLDLAKAGKVVLEAIDDRETIKQEDRDAAFLTPSGEVRNLVFWNHD